MKYIISFSLIFLLFSCSKPNPWQLTLPSKLEESGEKTPVITKISDLDSYILPQTGKLDNITGNQEAIIHENILVRGKFFGRGPTLTIGNKAVKILGRTEDGGILAKIPSGIKNGKNKIIVTTENGKSGSTYLTVKRFGAGFVTGNKKVAVFSYPDFKTVKTLNISNPGFIRFSYTKPLLYILEKTPDSCKSKITNKCKSRLHTIDLSIMKEIDVQNTIKGYVYGFNLAPQKDTAVITTNYGIQVLTLERTLTPVAYQPQKWTQEINSKNIFKTLLTPVDAKTLVLLYNNSNKITFIDIQVPELMKIGKTINIFPEEKFSLIKTASFDYKDKYQTLWIATGDTVESLKTGYHPSFLISYEVISAVDRTSEIKIKKEEEKSIENKGFMPNFLIISRYGINKAENTGHSDWDRYFYVAMNQTEYLTLKNFNVTTPEGTQKLANIQKTPSSLLYRITNKNLTKNLGSFKYIIGDLSLSYDGYYSGIVSCKPTINLKNTSINKPTFVNCNFFIKNLSTSKTTNILDGKLNIQNMIPPFSFGKSIFQD